MKEVKTVRQQGKRISLGLVVLSVFLTFLLCSLSWRLLRDLRKVPAPPDRQAIEEDYRSRLQGGEAYWEQAQAGIEAAIDAESRASLLKDAVPLAFDGEYFYLGIPDDTHRDAVERRHHKQLRDALRDAAGEEIQLSLRAYHGWKWTDPLEVERSKANGRLRTADAHLRELNEKTPQIQAEYETATETLQTLLNVQNAKSAAGQPLSAEERSQLETQQGIVIDKQKTHQAHQSLVGAALRDRAEAQKQLEDLNQTIADRDSRARIAYDDAFRVYRLKVFALQSVVVVALLLIAAYILAKKRQSQYITVLAAFVFTGGWVFWWFLWEYVPVRILEYLVRAFGVAVLLVLMVGAVKRFQRLSSDRVMKQIREALLAKRCPNCNFPFYEGRANYEVLGLRDKKLLKNIASGSVQVVKTDEAPHNFCQNCGLTLVDTCKECGTEKYALLPHCPKCNAETDVLATYQAHIDNHTPPV